MISNELKKFYDCCMKIESSYLRSWLADDPNWTTHRICNYSNGVIFGLYRENDPSLLLLMKKQYDIDELHRLICKAVDKTNAIGKKMFVDCGRDPENAPTKNYPNKEQNLVKWFKSYNSCIIEPLSRENDNSILSFLYIYYAYEEYSASEKECSEIEKPHIHQIYSDETNDDFRVWNLIPIIDANRVLKAYSPPRIFDQQKDLTLFVDLPRPFVQVLLQLQEHNAIGKLAVRCRDDEIFKGLIEHEVLCEDVEQGRIFTLNVMSLPSMTKLYNSKEYNNQLWVKKTDTDLTFEELCDDFSVERDSIVTKMIHMSYSNNNINHIDYEKIYYTADEYQNRMCKMNTKGTAHKRQKHFKINDSCIPFCFPCNVLQANENNDKKIQIPFIFFVLNCFFSNKELIDEYFKDILDD